MSREYYAKSSTHVPFVIFGTISIENNRLKYEFRDGVADLLRTKKQHSPTDFISVAKAKELIFHRPGLAVSHSTTARWVAENNLGYKLPGNREQWIVDGVLFKEFIQQVKGRYEHRKV